MRNFFYCRFFAGLIFVTALFISTPCGVYGKRIPLPYTDEDKEMIISLVEPTPVIGGITTPSALMIEPYENSTIICEIGVPMKVEILMDISEQWYFVRDGETGKEGWLLSSYLDIPLETAVNTSVMGREQLEGYVNITGRESETEYLIWTDISRQLTHIFTGAAGKWELMRTLVCSTGKNASPTIRGAFKIQERGDWFYSERMRSGAKYWVRFHNNYLYHSVAMDRDKNITDASLGNRQSSGCVRLSVEDAEWFYRSIPEGSTVLVY